jgi:hemerythrin-like metal-binding protein
VPDATAAIAIPLGNAEIDAVHSELARLVQHLAIATGADFSSLFNELLRHTDAHFAAEERVMDECGFPHSAEHLSEHRQMMQEMRRFAKGRPAIARAYIRERLPERFNLHITRMDSLLAAYLRGL